MIIALYLSCIYILSEAEIVPFTIWQPELFIAVAIATCATIGFGSLSKISSLSRDVQGVAIGLGGQLVEQSTSDPQERELLNVVEEMAIAAGVAVPNVYVLPEVGINAFAAGFSPNSALIGVTQGALQKLHRNELQGVIGHEFSHIVNGDMATNLKMMGLMHGLLCIHLIGREILANRSRRSSNSDKKNPIIGLAIAAFVIGIIGWVFGQLIKRAISRQREYLADASAVQFTRDPNGITDALRRIAMQPAHSHRMTSAQAESASHLFFNDVSLLGSLASPFSTHPPLAERIRRLGGGSETLAPSRSALTQTQVMAAPTNNQAPNPIELIAQTIPAVGISESVSTTSSVVAAAVGSAQMNADAVVSGIGTVKPAHMEQAHSLLKHLPGELIEQVRTQPGAVAVVYALLLDTHSEVRSRQKQIVLDSSPTVHKRLEKIEPIFKQVDVRSRLPLLELCIPTLKQLKPPIAAQLFTRIKLLIQADSKLSVSEFAIQCVLQYRLAPHFRPEKSQPEVSQLSEVWSDVLTLCSALAQAGHSNASQIDYAFRSGIHQIPGARKQSLPTATPSANLNSLSKALSHLRHTTPKLKQSIAEACAHIVLIDSKTTDAEAELLRAVLICLGCPVPPFLNVAQPQQRFSQPRRAA